MYQAEESRYDKMSYKRCGNSGILLPRVSLGMWQNFGAEKPLPEQKEIIFRAFDLGITHFDLANNYGAPNIGMAEENFGKIEKTKYMTCTGDQYYENDKSTAFGRDYANGLSFIGILPNDEGDFTLEDLDISGLLKSNPEYDAVDCKMPKLNFETSTVLNDMLSNLGLDNIFSSNADFSGIADQNVNVDTILQKTKLELDENGTKAAAVTAVTMECMSAAVEDEPIIKTVELTRPFAFLIYDRNNDEVLFIGKVLSVS